MQHPPKTQPESPSGSSPGPGPRNDADRYIHGYHAGNVGDVLKHLLLIAVLDGLRAASQATPAAPERPFTVLDSHAGAGRYRLGPTGEWTAGVGRLDAAWPDAAARAGAAPALAAYLAAVDPPRLPTRGGRYPGSPALAAARLGPDDRLVLHEIEADVRAELAAVFTGDHRVAVLDTDGFSAVERTPADLVLVDPPYSSKAEWARASEVVIGALRARPHTAALLWYPIKSPSRPAGLKNALRKAGLAATAVELLSTPFETDSKRRNALNGSGVLLVNAPPGALAASLLALAAVGPAMATRGRWQLAVDGWIAETPEPDESPEGRSSEDGAEVSDLNGKSTASGEPGV